MGRGLLFRKTVETTNLLCRFNIQMSYFLSTQSKSKHPLVCLRELGKLKTSFASTNEFQRELKFQGLPGGGIFRQVWCDGFTPVSDVTGSCSLLKVIVWVWGTDTCSKVRAAEGNRGNWVWFSQFLWKNDYYYCSFRLLFHFISSSPEMALGWLFIEDND